MIDHIDYSQYSSWQFCPWHWYERYVLKRRKKWPEGLREDALAIGSLVHAGLENWYAHNDQTIPKEIIERITPTADALGLTRRMVYGYVQTYPREHWELIRCEQPIRFRLINGRDGLAKIDLYFYIAKPTVVESGVEGYEITLKPGWWIQEYKTKSPATSTADFMHEWTTKMQADFQMLALAEHLNSTRIVQAAEIQGLAHSKVVNGLLVNVIEKPREYVPRRKCKGCGEYWNYSAWQPGEGGKFACPGCHNEQALKPVDSEKYDDAKYFRMVVERTPEQLHRSKGDIQKIAERMKRVEDCSTNEQAEYIGLCLGDIEPPNKEHCFDNSRKWGKECEFYTPHTYNISTINNDKYEEAEDYLNEPTVG